MISINERIANLSPAKRALLEQHLQTQNTHHVAAQTIPRQPAALSYPLSFGQQRHWLIQQLEPENRAFYTCVAWQLTGLLNIDALTRSLGEIVSRHAVLRTRILFENGEPVQRIDPVAPFHLPLIDLRHLGDEDTDTITQVQALIHKLLQRPYDFAAEHPWRFQLVQVADEDHVLLVAKHHIASDGWSSAIFQRELSLLYTAFTHQKATPLASLPIQYADFTMWQRSQMQGAKLEQQIAYWQQKLQNLPIVQLPTDYPRSPGQSIASMTHEFCLSPALTTALKALNKAHGLTLYMTLLAAFKLLLFRYTWQQDLAIGTPIAGRTHSEVEGLIGFFLNTLVLRSQINPSMTFLELLAQVRQTTLDAYAHQEIPVEKLIEVLQPVRTVNHSPLFQVLFLLQNMPRHALELPGLHVTRFPHTVDAAVYDLSCALHEEGGQIIGRLTYRRDLFLPTTIARLASHYQTLLQSAVEDPTCTVAALPMLTAEERRQFLATWNQTAIQHPIETSLVELFAAQVTQRPEAIAFITDHATITYDKLDRNANQLAGHLRATGVEKGTIVGVCLPRSFDAVIALLAIFKVGAVYLPLDPAYPRKRLAFMLADSAAPLIITTTRLQPTLPTDSATLVCIDKLPVILSSCHPITTSPCHPDDPAYMIYTSGSTGQPKGVVVPHRQILNRLWWMWRNYPFQPEEVSGQKTALSFVDSLWELLGPLLQGSPTVIIPDEVVRDPQRLIQSLAKHGITRLWLVPTLLRAMLQTVPDLGTRLPKLRFLVASGEALPVELLRLTKAKLPHVTLYNLYGTSEVWDATWYDPTEEQVSEGSTVPIGKPIDNVQCYILDKHHQPVPIGVTGELYIGGAGLADGYWNHTALTTEKFINWPLPPTTNQWRGGSATTTSVTHRLYQTGDLARYHVDGNIQWMGRADYQVKLRGFRIELGEIEAVLLQHSRIKDAVVVMHEGESGSQQLAAYLIADSKPELDAAQLRQYLHNHLPPHMLPTTYTWMDAFPLTPSGKVNRTELSPPDATRTVATCEFAAARDELEMQLVQLWQKLLHLQPIGIHDNFFDIGGHSLLAITLFDQIGKVTGKVLPLSVLLQAPTVAQQALLLRQQDWHPQWSSLVAVRSGGSKAPIFLVPPARGTALSFRKLACHLDPDQPIYAFEPIGLDGAQEPLCTIEAIAAHYLQDLRLFQPEGPYRLGGMCVGAHVAFEMVRQLQNSGAAVDCLLILDAGAPVNGPDWHWTPHKRTPAHYSRLLIDLARTHTLRHVLKMKWRKIEQLFNKRHYQLEMVYEAQRKASYQYTARPISQRVFLVQSQQYANRPEQRARWATLATEGLIHHTISGTTHRSLIATNDQHIAYLAKQLQQYLDQLDQQVGEAKQ